MTLNIVGLGEVLWDLLPTGPQLGGAPANFACHVQALGEQIRAQADVITRIGEDDSGREVLRRFHEMRLGTPTVQVDRVASTGTAKVELSKNGVANFIIEENIAWDFLAPTDEARSAVGHADAICFGTLAQRSATSRTTIQQLVLAAPANTLRVLDINLRQPFYSRRVIEESLQLANVLKLNDEELPIVAEMFSSGGADTPVRGSATQQPLTPTRVSAPREIKDQIECLAQIFDLQLVALTRGADGSLLYQAVGAEHRWSDSPSRSMKVVDAVGAGDSFTAALVLGLLQEMDLDEINQIANDVAGYVCSQPGATPQLPLEFAERFSGSQ
jgi:fructokinase